MNLLIRGEELFVLLVPGFVVGVLSVYIVGANFVVF